MDEKVLVPAFYRKRGIRPKLLPYKLHLRLGDAEISTIEALGREWQLSHQSKIIRKLLANAGVVMAIIQRQREKERELNPDWR
jgi:hypothetical protein